MLNDFNHSRPAAPRFAIFAGAMLALGAVLYLFFKQPAPVSDLCALGACFAGFAVYIAGLQKYYN